MQSGTRIGDYEMVRPLGSGGMAEVWLARNPHMNRPFAIKFILPQLAANREIQTRFRDEAWRQSALQHPNIAQILTVLSEGGQNYIVMEYVESGLDKRLFAQRGAPLPLPEAVDIALQVLDALEYTHTLREGSLIHRDIKPANILLKADGSVRLTDFGIALEANGARRTMAGQVLGTALYMSPEQIVAPSRVGRQTDIYSFACVLYEMLTGRTPFGSDSETDFSVQSDHMNRTPEPVRKFNASVPERFEWVVLKALAKDPNYRFQSCREMGGALLTAYREERLPIDLLRSYHGGLSSAWNQGYGQPIPEGQYRDPLAQTLLPNSRPTNPPQPMVGPATTASAAAWSGNTMPPVPPKTVPPMVPYDPYRGGQMISPQPPTVIPSTGPVAGRKRSKGSVRPLLYLLALLLLAGAGTGVWWLTRSEEILRMEGSTSVGDKLAPALAAEFLNRELHAESVNTKVTTASAADGSKYQIFEVSGRVGLRRQVIRIVSNGSGKAFSALANQTADLGMSSRPYTESDPADLNYLPNSNSNEHVIALDGIAVIVNSANHLQTLSLPQLKSIFTGQVTSWSQANGNGGRIHCYGRDSASGTYEMFRNKVVGKSGTLNAIDSSDQFADGKALVEKIASDPDGIGYVTFTQASGVRAVAVSDQGTTAMYPNSLTVSTEDYVLTRRLYLYQPRDASKVAGDFVTFAQDQEGQAVVSSNGFVSLMPKVHDEPSMADAPEDYRGAVSGLGRLGVSFRFTSGNGSLAGNGGYALDSLAQDNLLRLKAYMEQHTNDELVLLGFTDSQRSPLKSNRELGTERAQSVADELMRNGIPARVHGLGDEMPVASNLTPDGRAKNRRVEVWVRSGRS